MAEKDLLWMSAVVFIPSIFALLLIFVPRGKEEVMRWLSLAASDGAAPCFDWSWEWGSPLWAKALSKMALPKPSKRMSPGTARWRRILGFG